MTREPQKVVILCGGLGTRMREETEFRPKPMVEVGGRPILWHIMKMYSHHGYRDFVLALGYKGEIIVDFFESYRRRCSDYTLTLSDSPDREYFGHLDDDERHWRITFGWTGAETMTGGRLRRLRPYLQDGTFLATYGDGVSDVDIPDVVNFHRKSGHQATLVGVKLPTTFGVLEEDGGKVTEFREKPVVNGRINGGFFVFEPSVLELLRGDEEVLEDQPLRTLVQRGQLGVYRHDGFWKCMDTVKDVKAANDIWHSGRAPWKLWR
jgi:glucose-1-phosphate cytidylyltransferase